MRVLAFGLFLALLLYLREHAPTDRYVNKNGSFVEVTPGDDGTVTLFLSGSYGMNTCQIDTGPVKKQDSELQYDNADDDCHLRVKLQSQNLAVDQKGDCGCGLNVNLSGEYKKQPTRKRKQSSPASQR